MSPSRATNPNTHTVRAKDLQERETSRTREECAEIHAIKRIIERYADYGITRENAADTMMEHLAMLLAGQSEHRLTEKGKHHRGNEIHRIWWNRTWFYLSYDPSIKRIVTYLPQTQSTVKLARPKILKSKHRR